MPTPLQNETTIEIFERKVVRRKSEVSDLAAASGRAGLNTLTLANLYCRLVVDSSGTHTFLNLSRHGQECLFDVRGILSRCLEKRDSKAIGEFLIP
jgi:hypothetical protein